LKGRGGAAVVACLRFGVSVVGGASPVADLGLRLAALVEKLDSRHAREFEYPPGGGVPLNDRDRPATLELVVVELDEHAQARAVDERERGEVDHEAVTGVRDLNEDMRLDGGCRPYVELAADTHASVPIARNRPGDPLEGRFDGRGHEVPVLASLSEGCGGARRESD
jgi:hypothetical protein